MFIKGQYKMKKKYQFYLPFLIMLGFASYAADVEVRVMGKVVTQTCNVIRDDKEKYVTFPDFNQGDFRAVGDVSEVQSVKVGLEGCNQAVNQITYIFSGQPEPSDPSLLKVLGDGLSDASSGLAIEILDSMRSPIKLSQSYVLKNIIFQDGGKYNFNFFLRYKSISTIVTTGNASSVLYLDFNYE